MAEAAVAIVVSISGIDLRAERFQMLAAALDLAGAAPKPPSTELRLRSNFRFRTVVPWKAMGDDGRWTSGRADDGPRTTMATVDVEKR